MYALNELQFVADLYALTAELGTYILLIQPVLKTCDPIDGGVVDLNVKVVLFSELPQLKALFLIVFTFIGIVKFVKLVQPLKAK